MGNIAFKRIIVPLQSRCHSNDSGDILRSGPHPELLLPSINIRLKPVRISNIKKPNATRSVELVRTRRQKINSKSNNIKRDMSDRLYRIRMNSPTRRGPTVANRSYVLNRAELVIRQHHGNKAFHARAQRIHGQLWEQPAILADRQIFNRTALSLQLHSDENILYIF